MERPVGVAALAICLMILSLLLFAFELLAVLGILLVRPTDFLISLPGIFFYSFLFVLPAAIGWKLWNMENSARVVCLIALGAIAVAGPFFLLYLPDPIVGVVLYIAYLIAGGGIATYLCLPTVKKVFEGEIAVINFKEL
jgi:hypothetical protein